MDRIFMMHFKIIFLCLLLTKNGFAICEREKQERDHFKGLCDTFSALSAGIAAGASLLHPLLGLCGIIPGSVAQNVCRILTEKERNLERCQRDHYAQENQAENLEIERSKTHQRLHEQRYAVDLNHHEQAMETIRHDQNGVRQMFIRFQQEGRNLHDPFVQIDIREIYQRLQQELREALERLEVERQLAVAAIH